MIKMDVRVERSPALDELLSGRPIMGVLSRTVKRVADETKIRMAVYPPEGDWNKPGPYPKRWYQRHVGPRYALKSGGVGGKNTSEMLQKNWQVRIAGKLTRDVINETSYAALVQGADEQASFHAAHGWQTNEMVAEDISDNVVDRVLLEEIQREFA